MQGHPDGSARALLLAALVLTQPAYAQEAQNQVMVSAGSADRLAQSTAVATVVGHDELLRQGDATLADALKRQPGITVDGAPGKPAALRLRGLGGGYAAILLNGLPAPNGFALESLDPNLVERVEILRAGTAETSGQSIAGSINIVLRKAAAGANELKVGAASGAHRIAPSLVVQRTGRSTGQFGAAAFTLAATVKREDTPTTATVVEQGLDAPLLRRTAVTWRLVEDTLELAPRLSWQASPRDALSAQAWLRVRRLVDSGSEAETTSAGQPTPFPLARHRYAGMPRHAFGEAAWNRRLDEGARLALKVSGYATSRAADFNWLGMAPDGAPLETHRVASGPSEREWIASGSWRRPLAGGHQLAAGWEFGDKRRDEYRRELQTDPAGRVLLSSDEAYGATVRRTAWYVQDEWEFGPSRSIYVGLRREDLRTSGAGNAHLPVDVRAGAWSPIVQALFERELDGSVRDQYRLAVSRTYRAPNIVQLMPRRYTVDNGNSAVNPDQQGNPALKPELALGIDLAWERRIAKATSFGAGVFAKRIRDVILDRSLLTGGTWIATPDNQGGASVRGVELEGKTSWGALALHGNAARTWSRLDDVPGPDNRMDGQPKASGTLGLDNAPAGGIEWGASWTWRGSAASRRSSVLAAYGGGKRQLDAYALLRFKGGRLRLSGANLLHGDYMDAVVHAGPGGLARSVDFRTHAVWRATWEQGW